MDELAFLPATEQARLVREGEVSPVELVETYLERIERLDPELGAFVTVCAEEALADAREKAALLPRHRSTACRSRSRTSTRRPGSARRSPARRSRENVPDFDLAHVARTRAAGFVIPRQDEHARVRDDGVHRLAAERPLPDALGPRPERGRLERRRRGGRRGRTRADRAGLRRRRLDPDPRLLLRPLRDQGLPRPRLERAVRAGIGLGTTGPLARTTLDAAAYLDLVTGYEWGDPFPAAPPERPFVEEIGVDPGRLRIALTTEAPIETDGRSRVCRCARDAAELLASLGHEVEEAAPDWGGRGADGGLPAGLAGDSGALSDRGSDRAVAAEPVVPRGRDRDHEPRVRRRDRAAAAARTPDRRPVGRLRPAC